jgi:hypothetical protein
MANSRQPSPAFFCRLTCQVDFYEGQTINKKTLSLSGWLDLRAAPEAGLAAW